MPSLLLADISAAFGPVPVWAPIVAGLAALAAALARVPRIRRAVVRS
jgi:hypothetical protein